MNDHVIEYDSAEQMRKLRASRETLGLKERDILIVLDQAEWWRGQAALATAAQLESAVARSDAAVATVANLRPKVRAKLVEAEKYRKNAPENLLPLVEDFHSAMLDQQYYNKEGSEALEAKEYAQVERSYAMEYISFLKAKGYRHLIGYYMNGGVRPRVLDDV